MKILFIHNRYQQPGGEDIAVGLESALLAAKGHTVETLFFDNSAFEKTLSAKLRAPLRVVYNRDSRRLAASAIRRFQPDLIHVHNLFFTATPSVLYAAAEAGKPVIMTLHNYRLICCNALLLRDNRPCELCVENTFPAQGIRHRCFRGSAAASATVTMATGFHKMRHTWNNKVSRYIALTDFARHKFLDSSLRLRGDQLVTKPNFTTDLGAGAWPRKDFYLFAGRLSPEKGLTVLLDAFSAMPDREIVIAGTGPEEDSLRKTYGARPNIRFIGAVGRTTLIDLMKSSRALLLPSLWYEGLPYVVIEAFSTGTPVIASRLGAMTSLVSDGVNGFHFEPGDADGLRGAVDRLETAGEAVYRQARQTYLDLYHPDIHYNRIMKIYTDSINEFKATHV